MSGRPPRIPDIEIVRNDARRSLQEDIGAGDASAGLVAANTMASARVVCRDEAILAGCAWFEACLRELDPNLHIDWHSRDGDKVAADSTVCSIRGFARALLSGERSALNFLQTLSGTATVTASYVAVTAGTATVILDTRKTLPGLRYAQKYAVCCGGGSNHRMGLYDAILIKENHILASGSLASAVSRARSMHPELLLEVEVENMAELEQALMAGVDWVMLDEFDNIELKRALAFIDRRVQVEVSGSVELPRLRELVGMGIDYISIGALTKHVRAVDLSMRITAD